MLFLVDLFIVGMIPLEELLNFESLNKDGKIKMAYNVIYLIGWHQYFLYITDIFNGLILLVSFLVALGFLFYYREPRTQQKNFNKGFLSFLSFIIIVFGRYLGHFFLSTQILAMRCYFQHDVCYSETDVIRLSTNSIGFALNLLVMLTQIKSTNCIFPEQQIPWAKPKTRLELIFRLLILVAALELAFEDFLVGVL